MDILDTQAGRFLIAKSLSCSPNVAVVGQTQIGKSTFVFWLANEITRIQYLLGITKKETWDYKQLCAKSFVNFKEIVDDTNNSVVVLEEAGIHLESGAWWSLENKLFSKLMQTQAYKRNIYIVVMPSSRNIAKEHRVALDFLFSVEYKNVDERTVKVKPNYILKKYWLLKDRNFSQIWLNRIHLQYSEEFIKESKKYTAWLEDYKKEIMDMIQQEYDEKKKGFVELEAPTGKTGFKPVVL